MSDGPLIRDDSPQMPDLDYEMILGEILTKMIEVEQILTPKGFNIIDNPSAVRRVREVRSLCESVLSVLSG